MSGGEPAAVTLESIRNLAALYSPESERALLEALFGIESEILASVRPGLDHHVAHTRLQWWREECERCAQGRPVHPLTRALVAAYGTGAALSEAWALSAALAGPNPITRHAQPLAGLGGFVDTAVWDLASATFETRRELTAYCERWAAAMIEPIAAHALAIPLPGLGAALRELEMLSELAPEAHLGRLRVPLDELDRVRVESSALATPPWSPGLVALLVERHEALRTTINASVAELSPTQQPKVRGLLVWAALACHKSLRTQRALPHTAPARRIDAFSDAWHAWRFARAAASGRFREI